MGALGYQDVTPSQLTLFGEEPETPLPLHLVAADAYGFTTLKPGRGGRLDKRLLNDAMTAPPMEVRRPGGRYEWARTVEEMAADYWGEGVWRPGKHGRQLVEAVQAIRVGAVGAYPRGALRPPDRPRDRSRHPRPPGPQKPRRVRGPLSADLPVGGPRYNRPALLAAGRVSDPAYDLELSLAWHFDALRHPNRKAAPPRVRPGGPSPPRLRAASAEGQGPTEPGAADCRQAAAGPGGRSPYPHRAHGRRLAPAGAPDGATGLTVYPVNRPRSTLSTDKWSTLSTTP